ncbi:MAG: SgcJ/EcaC family oxidoreductase, partial [Chitinophagaceae bacterium]
MRFMRFGRTGIQKPATFGAQSAPMRLLLMLLLLPLPGLFAQTNAKDAVAIAATLHTWDKALRAGDAAAAASVFDEDEHVLMIGSAPGEKFRGKAAIRAMLNGFVKSGHEVAWDLANATIDQNGNTAWVFVDGAMRIKEPGGNSTEMPYRLSIVLVRRGNAWKWRFFHGGVPAKPIRPRFD